MLLRQPILDLGTGILKLMICYLHTICIGKYMNTCIQVLLTRLFAKPVKFCGQNVFLHLLLLKNAKFTKGTQFEKAKSNDFCGAKTGLANSLFRPFL